MPDETPTPEAEVAERDELRILQEPNGFNMAQPIAMNGRIVVE